MRRAVGDMVDEIDSKRNSKLLIISQQEAAQVRRAVGDMVEEIDSKRKKSLAALQRGLAIDSEAPLLKRASRSFSKVGHLSHARGGLGRSLGP